MNRPSPIRPAILCLAFAAACGGTSSAPGPASRGGVLSNGVKVDVSATGAVSLSLDGRPMLAMPEGAPPVVRSFDESYQGATAIWTFARTGVSEEAITGLRAVRRDGDAVVVELGDPAATTRAVLRVHPDARQPEATVLEMELDPALPPAPPLSGSGATSLRSPVFPVRIDPDASFMGFGEQYNAVDQRGEAFTLLVSEQGIGRKPGGNRALSGDAHTTYFPMPWYLDARGFGVLFRTPRRVDVDLGRTDPGTARFELVGESRVELVVFPGPHPLDVVRQLGGEVGRPTVPPDWAFDLWVSAQGGTEKVLARAAKLQANEVPAGAIWSQDWTGLRRNFDGGYGVQYRWQADETHYPGLADMIRKLHGDGFRFLAYVNPFVDEKLPNHFPEMKERGLLVTRENGESYVAFAPNGSSSHPDLTKPEAREYVKSQLRAMILDYGIDGWMADFAEWVPLDARFSDGTDGGTRHNLFPEAWQRLSREVMDELRPGDGAVFARSGWTGVQSVSQIHWTGDQETGFEAEDGLPTVVPAMLNLGLSGVPFATHDIAGFSSSTVPPSTKEVFLRWTELGAFTPIMRTHDGNKKLDNWAWDSDEETIAHFRRFARIHRALGPELRALAAEARETSAPMVRHPVLVFPDEPAARAVNDEFLLGDSLLVAPVVEAGATTRDLWLPPGTWYDVWTGAALEGGRRVVVDAPIGRPPVFSRDRDREDLRAIR
ncbi:MAG: TIM-barrel domain-containing protein [Alphaproteobacteria bacterium]